MRLRPVERPGDLPAITTLVAELTALDGHSPLGEHKYLDLLGSGSESVDGLVVEGDDGALAAYVAASRNQGIWTVELAIHPAQRSRVPSILDGVAGWVGDAGGESIRIWAYQDDLAAALDEGGFSVERRLHQLRRKLPAPTPSAIPDGMDLRPFVAGADEQDWLALNGSAFSGHPENGSWDAEMLRNRMEQDWFEPDALLMLWAGPSLAGFCWTKMVDSGVGEIYVIAVDPPRQGAGLGRWLLLAGLQLLVVRYGANEVMLYVDSENGPAQSLYRSLEFGLDHVDRAFTKELY